MPCLSWRLRSSCASPACSAAFLAAKLLGYDMGTAAGLLAGAFTESTVIGTAGDAINRLSIPAAEKTELMNNIPVAYAVTYLIGTAFIVWFLPNIGPRLMRVNLKEEGKKLQAKISEPGRAGGRRAIRLSELRGPGVPRDQPQVLEQDRRGTRGHAQGDCASSSPASATKARSSRPSPATVIHPGDVVAVMTRTELLMARGTEIGPEVDDKALLDFPQEFLDVVITNKALAGKDPPGAGGPRVCPRGLPAEAPAGRGADAVHRRDPLDRGDVMSLVGAKRDVERAAKELGYADRPTITTDMIFVGLGIFFGGLVGLLTVTIGGLPITLTASGGALVMGLVFGWLRSVRPTFGRIPEPAMWVFDTVGLTVFMAVVGLGAGPSFIAGLQKSGISLVFVGLVVAVLPHVTSILFGRYVLKMNPLILLGACSGAGTITAALRAVQDESQSKLPALGYTVPYALGNILLTAWGPVIVAMMA